MSIWSGVESRGWDGTGHYSIAQLYTQSIFPNTFGWSDSYFGGMPFPNFYPPVFYWVIAGLTHTSLVSFTTAFKIALTLPILLLPAAIWMLSWYVSQRNWLVATGASLASTLLLTDMRLMGSVLAGLDYFSTFQIGLYTQPLGFVLMIAWFLTYSVITQPHSNQSKLSSTRLIFATVLLALTVLSNFFNAITAMILVLSTLLIDLVSYKRSRTPEQRRIERDILIVHVLSPAAALGLTLFWVIPMLSQYPYFVTRPHVAETVISSWLMIWYGIAAVGAFLWIRQVLGYALANKTNLHDSKSKRLKQNPGAGQNLPYSRAALPYLITCLVLAGAVGFSSTIAPVWFPLQGPRFLATLTFLLTIPVGFAFATAFQWLAALLREGPRVGRSIAIGRMRYTSGVFLVAFLVIAISGPELGWTYVFYNEQSKTEIAEVLEFAREHQDGRYLVEVINPKIGPAWTEASFDARAINSYLGAQGNETISGVFHEASPSALFTLPVVNAFSNYPDSFGISSILADDLDFRDQPLMEHARRLQFLGVKYLVIRTPTMKERVSKELPSAIRHDLGWWAVFELRELSALKIQTVPFKPALVLSDFTLKARRRNESSFVRLVEEQFADNWFDVLLVKSDEFKIDRIQNLDRFGALIIDKYEYSDENIAFERLREFAKNRPVICLSDDNALVRRLRETRTALPMLQIIERHHDESGEIVDALQPTYRYGLSQIRQQWKSIRSILETHKTPTDGSPSEVIGEYAENSIHLNYEALRPARSLPVLISTTFHPNWSREDGEAVYAATPFFMLTFIDRPVTVTYRRQSIDRVALWVSCGTLAGLLGFTFWSYRRSLAALMPGMRARFRRR